ncbi:MAG: hypothetical protein KDK08_05650 [Rhizobiaceae bacterium]|nr:hypothetical protein [Rhizobiaceae bacterium]MCC0000953.1 hypothetical protein [Methylobacteriaceae bacterium]
MTTDPFAFYFDLEEGFIKFVCGWIARIDVMFDVDGDVTNDPDECAIFQVFLSEGSVYVELDEPPEETIH